MTANRDSKTPEYISFTAHDFLESTIFKGERVDKMLTKKGMPKKLGIYLSLILVIACITSCAHPIQEDSSKIIVPVTVTKVLRGTIDNITHYTGLVQPSKLAYVVSPVAGKVASTFFEVGDYVKEGDLLFSLDNSQLEDSIKVLEEQLKVAEATLSLAQTGVISASGGQYESQRLQLKTALKSAEDNFTAAKVAYDSAALMYEVKLINQLQYNQIKNQYKQAQNALNSAIQARDLYESKLSKDAQTAAQDQFNQAQASYDMLKLQIENTRKQLAYTQVKSPMDGVIATKDIVTGCLISNTMTPYTIMKTDRVQVVLSVTEKVINRIKKGDTLDITIPSISTNSFNGVIATVSPAVDQKTLTYSIRIDVINSGNLIKPGMTAKVGILTDRHENAILVPDSSVLTNENGSFVYVAENNQAVMKYVNTGIASSDKTEILNGINEGELLVVKGQHFLKPNDAVIISGEDNQ